MGVKEIDGLLKKSYPNNKDFLNNSLFSVPSNPIFEEEFIWLASSVSDLLFDKEGFKDKILDLNFENCKADTPLDFEINSNFSKSKPCSFALFQ